MYVPTHRYLSPGTGAALGFEPLLPPGFAGVRDALSHLAVGRRRPVIRAPVAIAELDRVLSEPRPLFAWIHFMETHDPYRWGADGEGPSGLSGLRHAARDLDPHLAGAIERFRSSRRRPAIVALFGDHGEEFGEHGGRFHSSSTYAEQVRVVFWLAGPGLSGVVRAPVSLTALPATLAELAGIPPLSTASEPSVVACARHGNGCPVIAVSELRHAGRTMVGYTGVHHRLVYDPVHRIEELYDHRRDPREQHNLAATDAAALRRLGLARLEWDESH